jgi:hypothetical protein
MSLVSTIVTDKTFIARYLENLQNSGFPLKLDIALLRTNESYLSAKLDECHDLSTSSMLMTKVLNILFVLWVLSTDESILLADEKEKKTENKEAKTKEIPINVGSSSPPSSSLRLYLTVSSSSFAGVSKAFSKQV